MYPQRRDFLVFVVGLLLGSAATVLVMQLELEPEPPAGPRTVVVVYESLQQPLPRQATDARSQLESDGHTLLIVDDDVTTGEGNTPEYLISAIEEARSIGLPALVILADGQLLSAQLLPATAAEIILEVGGGD